MESTPPVFLFVDCEILTMNKLNSTADAMAVFKDNILSIGPEQQVRSEISKERNIMEFELNGACIVPGFIDTHMHPGYYIYFKTQRDLSEVKSYARLEEILKSQVEKKAPGEWIMGFDLMEDVFKDPKERRFPTRHDLDKVSTEIPILIFRHDGHICAVNSVALKRIGIDETNVKEKTPEFGEIQVDKDGKPTGIFTEDAIGLASDAIQIPDINEFREAARLFSKELASHGITTCGGMVQTGNIGPAGKTGEMEHELLRVLLNEDLVQQDLVLYFGVEKARKLKRFKKTFIKNPELKDRYVVDGIKIYGDGSFGAFTACMFEPFSDSKEGKAGFMVISKEKLYELVHDSLELGFSVATHAIGDKANRIVVDVYREVLSTLSLTDELSPRLRIEHASAIKEDALKDAASSNIILCCQPAFINSEHTWLEKRLGSKRLKYTYPFRSIIDSGCILAGASDAPIESVSVLDALQACVTRQAIVPEESITVMEALKMFTYNAAYALRQEKIKGSLEKGKIADFVILDKNLEKVPRDKISEIKVLETYCHGKSIYHHKGN